MWSSAAFMCILDYTERLALLLLGVDRYQLNCPIVPFVCSDY